MANRNSTFLLKRSNVIDKVPNLTGLTIGELALNTADAKLYTIFTSGTTGGTEVRQIGWDRLSITGGTINGDLTVTGDTIVGDLSANTLSILNIDTGTTSNNVLVYNDITNRVERVDNVNFGNLDGGTAFSILLDLNIDGGGA